MTDISHGGALPGDPTALDIAQLQQQAAAACQALLQQARLKPGDILVVGCSTSEVAGGRIGQLSQPQLAQPLLEALLAVTRPAGLVLAAQCCEHLNRALVLPSGTCTREKDELCSVIPQPKAGGSFATAYYRLLPQPVVLRHLKADAGLDIGQTLIGMHLREVAVPVRLAVRQIGAAVVTAARTRPPYIGGARAVYDQTLL
ncbi:MAG: TIGR01440 family protein [Oscillospiraceae bacterium]|nr:TIGR01440 family protein [Oscillospiraceae bacterium]MDD4369226.1 TIGR01440 family protein [Oscillospiraceae bacterium]